ncbi:type II toxin-antitoxin system RelE/ParE family toxin [Sphingomonas koreensis]|nr:type II toxin-antitoxin system RelE/ParE family toxin [Sphingomonas koreensis]
MRRIIWTREASDNLEDIRRYLVEFNAAAAQNLAQRIIATAQSLSEFPHRGRPIGDGLRQIALIYPYLIRYSVDGEMVIITGVRHGARSGDDAA